MGKKALIVTTVASTIDQFCMDNIDTLLEKGIHVDVAANFQEGNNTSNERMRVFEQELEQKGVGRFDIDFSRSVSSSRNLKAYRQIKGILKNGNYSLLHCHTPIGSIVSRLAARKQRKNGLSVLYTAHGFHFFQGAPQLNWMLYYPAEKVCSRFTDALVTINQEDYSLATKKMKVPSTRIYQIPGVGIDVKKLTESAMDRQEARRKLGFPADKIILLSVGELNENKNHEVILRALAEQKDPSFFYVIAGQGSLAQKLEELVNELGLQEQVQLLGYRQDIPVLCSAADIFCFPSKREGLGLAALEAMAFGLPLIASYIHGIKDYLIEGVTGMACAPENVGQFAEAIRTLAADEALRKKMGETNREFVRKFDVSCAHQKMADIYDVLLKETEKV